MFRDFSNNKYNDKEFIEEIKKYDKDNYHFYIGTDSQLFDKHISIVTAICPRKIKNGFGKSGKIFYFKEKLDPKKYRNLRSRMLTEAYRSIEMAIKLDPIISGKISIHLDIGSGKRSKTRAYHQELQYLVTAQGYDCSIKPNSWAAGSVADRVSKS